MRLLPECWRSSMLPMEPPIRTYTQCREGTLDSMPSRVHAPPAFPSFSPLEPAIIVDLLSRISDFSQWNKVVAEKIGSETETMKLLETSSTNPPIHPVRG